jgi:hypothetical protein
LASCFLLMFGTSWCRAATPQRGAMWYKIMVVEGYDHGQQSIYIGVSACVAWVNNLSYLFKQWFVRRVSVVVCCVISPHWLKDSSKRRLHDWGNANLSKAAITRKYSSFSFQTAATEIRTWIPCSVNQGH